jgi:hypothetical protein
MVNAAGQVRVANVGSETMVVTDEKEADLALVGGPHSRAALCAAART